jgi:hypothetical protein
VQAAQKTLAPWEHTSSVTSQVSYTECRTSIASLASSSLWYTGSMLVNRSSLQGSTSAFQRQRQMSMFPKKQTAVAQACLRGRHLDLLPCCHNQASEQIVAPGVLDLVAADSVFDVWPVRQRHVQRLLDIVPVQVRRDLVVDTRVVLALDSAACSATARAEDRVVSWVTAFCCIANSWPRW